MVIYLVTFVTYIYSCNKSSFRRFVTRVYVRNGSYEIYNHSGDDGKEDPPVSIPNTEVKLFNAESTCG